MTISTSAEPVLDASRLLTHLRDSARGPVSPDALASELELDPELVSRLQPLLDELVAAGTVVESRGRYGAPERMNLVVGRLSAHPDGFAFVVPPVGSGQSDLFIPGHQLRDALHGDRVIARFEHRRRSGKREGRVIRVLERARSRIVAKLEQVGGLAYARPLDRRLGNEIVIPPSSLGDAADGQIVSVEIVEYPKGRRGAVGRVVEVLGDAADAKVDAEIVIREYDLRHEFPAAVLKEASETATTVSEEEIEGRTDFRTLPIITIDGENAQDFDDAVHVEGQPDGTYRLHNHIADVAHYVAPGSHVDAEARKRATSVYFPDRVLPMLPESLSNGICSLKPGVDRLVQSLVVDIDRQGRTLNYEFHDGVIHSAARLTYRQVAAVLDGDDGARKEHEAHVENLERMQELAKLLMDVRRQRGSIDFDLPEPELIINLRGVTEDIVRAERNAAHRIIEEFMIRANEVVASHLTWEGVDGLYRVHEGPDETRVEALRDFLSGLGYSFGGGPTPSPRHFSELLERLEGRPEERVVSMLVLRTMKRAQYRVENEGHFGLASDRYTHFTSPIRRYPDLIVHRVLKLDRDSSAGSDAAVLAPADLESIASDCSTQERRAEEAEREYCGWKKVQFMSDKLGEVYTGHIVGVQAFGFFVELDDVLVEGMVPVSTLSDDYYRFDEAKHSLRGERGSRVLALGDQVRVRVAKADVGRRRLDFVLEEGPLPKAAPVPEKRARQRGGRRRRGRGKPAPLAADAPAGKEQQETAGVGDASEASSEGAKPRRRRGRRGGRRRRRSTPASAAGETVSSESSSAPADGAESAAEATTDTRAGGAGGSEKSAGSRGRRRRRGGARESESGSRRARGKSSADKGHGTGDDTRAKSTSGSRGRGGRGRGRNDRRPGGRGRRPEGALPAPTRPEPAEPATKPKDDKVERPSVNPYLTDLDF